MRQETSSFETLTRNEYEGRTGLVYARVSSKKQEVEGHGRESQDQRCKRFLDSVNVKYEESFLDTFSGAGDFMKRPAMKALLDYIDSHPHRKYVVVFDDLKRFARDVEFHLKLRAAFKIRGVVLKCLNYNLDESPEGKYTEIILAAGGELERLQNARQVVQKQKARLERGCWTFNGKKGYDIVPDPIYRRIAVPNKEGRVLAKALEGFATGNLPRKIDVAEYLVRNNFWKKKHPPERHLDQVSKFLGECFYCGDIEYPRWEVSRRPGVHQALISRETFSLIQKRLYRDSARSKPRRNISDRFPLRGLLLCSDCKKPLTGAASRGRKNHYSYYFCFNKQCKLFNKNFAKKDVEETFRIVMQRNKLKADSGKVITAVFDRVWAEEIKTLEQEERLTLQHIKGLNEKVEELTEMVRRSSSESLKRAYEAQIEKALDELAHLKPHEENDLNVPYRTALKKATGLLQKPYKTWQSLNVIEKHRWFFFLFEAKLEYAKEDGFRTADSLSHTRLFEEFLGETPNLVRPLGFEPRTLEV